MLKKAGLPPLEERARGPVLQARNAFLRDLESVVENEYWGDDSRAFEVASNAAASAHEERDKCWGSWLPFRPLVCAGKERADRDAAMNAERLADQKQVSFDLALYLRRLLNFPGPLLPPEER